MNGGFSNASVLGEDSPAPGAPDPIERAAIEYAKMRKLIDDNGQLWCMKGCGRAGRLPHLCCTICITRHRTGQR